MPERIDVQMERPDGPIEGDTSMPMSIAPVAIDVPRGTSRLDETLFLALRTCATHPAGPLRAVAEVQRAIEAGDLTREEARRMAVLVSSRYAEQEGVLAERVDTVRLFLAALWH